MDTAKLLVINVLLGKAVETASPVMEDMSYLKVPVSLILILSMVLAMSYALSGRELHALNVRKELSSIKTGFVFPLIHNAKLGILSTEIAYHAMVDISYPLMEDALNHLFKLHLMQDALVGVLILRHALSVHTDSSSILMENANKSQIFVLLGTKRTVFAQAVILDTIL
jgi:hypothetical protein